MTSHRIDIPSFDGQTFKAWLAHQPAAAFGRSLGFFASHPGR